MPKATILYPSTIVNANGNGGWHKNGKRAYRKAVETLYRCLQTYREPRLYHLCFEGKTNKKHVKMLNALVQMASRAGIRCEWFGAREKADHNKKDHLHAFIIIDAYGIKVAKVFNQFADGQIGQLCAEHGVKFSIFSPKDDGLHGRNVYIALPYQGPGNRQRPLGRKRLADALVWLSYLGKARSKPTEEEADGQIFPASRPTRMPKSSLPSAALPAAEEVAIQQTQRKESQNETVHETQTSASSEASSYNTSQGPATAGSEYSPKRGKTPQPSLVDAGQASSGGEAEGEAGPSIEPQRYSDSRATAYFERTEVRLPGLCCRPPTEARNERQGAE